MQSKLGGTCSSSCVCNLPIHEQGEYQLRDCTWDSDCPNRKSKVECTPHDACQNTRLTKKKFLELGKDLELKICWGVDVYTRCNIFMALGSYQFVTENHDFIDQLIKVSNFSNFEGWNLRFTCRKMREFIKQESERTKLGLKKEYWVYCRILEDFLLYRSSREGFRFFSKGLGVICKR